MRRWFRQLALHRVAELAQLTRSMRIRVVLARKLGLSSVRLLAAMVLTELRAESQQAQLVAHQRIPLSLVKRQLDSRRLSQHLSDFPQPSCAFRVRLDVLVDAASLR